MPSNEEVRKYLFDEGMKQRVKVLGENSVQKSFNNEITDFSRAGQELVTEIAWGTIWTRPGLTHKQRSLITLSILAARGKMVELAAHVHGALNNGLTEEELKELFLQVMVYCGAPSGMESFRAADAAIQAWKKEHVNAKQSEYPFTGAIKIQKDFHEFYLSDHPTHHREEAKEYLYQEGEKQRRKVMGDAHVDRSMAQGITGFARAGQELATEIGWGTIWTRPGLTLQQRSLISVSILAARGKPVELAGHVRGALNNGLTEDELKELFLQIMAYCGAAVGMESFRAADTAIRAWKEENEK